MIFGSNNTIRLHRSLGKRLLWASMFVALLYVFFTPNAQASIIVPDGELVNVDKLYAELDRASSSGASASTSPPQSPIESPSELEFGQYFASSAMLGGSSSNTSTSSSGGAGGSGNVPIQSLATATLPDLDLVGWTNGEARFALPTPPGNDLLRPPQFS